MQDRIGLERIALRRQVDETVSRFAEEVPPEAFKWLGWISAIAAVQVIAIRVDSTTLHVVSFALSLLLIGRVNWFLEKFLGKHLRPDSSPVVKFKGWKIFISFVLSLLAFYLAFGVPRLIAASDLLPPVREVPPSSISAPQAASAPAAAKPAIQNEKSPKVSPEASSWVP